MPAHRPPSTIALVGDIPVADRHYPLNEIEHRIALRQRTDKLALGVVEPLVIPHRRYLAARECQRRHELMTATRIRSSGRSSH